MLTAVPTDSRPAHRVGRRARGRKKRRSEQLLRPAVRGKGLDLACRLDSGNRRVSSRGGDETMIRLEHVTFRYEGGDYGVTDISLHVPQGACVVLCGASGCGKTTLTRLINGLAPRFYRGELKGSVVVGGEEVPSTPSWEMSARVGSVF